MKTGQTVIIVLLALAAGIAWLVQQREVTPGLELVTPGGPDVFVDGMRLDILDRAGQPVYRLTAGHMRHTAASDRLQLDDPRVEMTRPDGAVWTVQASRGEATQAGEQVWLHGPVDIVRSSDGRHPELRIETRDVAVKPALKVAETEHEARIRSGGLEIDAVGLKADFGTSRLELNARVRGRIDAAS